MNNTIAAKKLLNSKWTAVNPLNKQKHFVVVEVEYDENNTVLDCQIQAIMNKHTSAIDWQQLKNSKKWLQGWQ